MREHRILVVEDNEGDAVWLKRQLRKTSEVRFRVDRVGWLREAAQALALQSYDAALLDLSLPDCQGLDTVVEFMRAAPALPVVVMTGHDDTQTAINCVRYGVQGYVIKGKVSPRSLELTLLTAIERKRTDLVGKHLLHASLSGFEGEGHDHATVLMMREAVAELWGAVRDVRLYIGKNCSSHVESIEMILNRHNLPVVMREMQTVLGLDAAADDITPPHGRRRRAISDQAMKAVQAIVASRSEPALPRPSVSHPTDSPTAEATLLDVISRNSTHA